jgi:hypothetical protein
MRNNSKTSVFKLLIINLCSIIVMFFAGVIFLFFGDEGKADVFIFLVFFILLVLYFLPFIVWSIVLLIHIREKNQEKKHHLAQAIVITVLGVASPLMFMLYIFI